MEWWGVCVCPVGFPQMASFYTAKVKNCLHKKKFFGMWCVVVVVRAKL